MDNNDPQDPGSSSRSMDIFPSQRALHRLNVKPRKRKRTKPKKPEPPPVIEIVKPDSDSDSDPENIDISSGGPIAYFIDTPYTTPGGLHDISHGVDIISVVFNEISLEGLDGITLEALWTRMRIATNAEMSKTCKGLIWNYLKESNFFQFYQLPQKRPKLVVVNRFDYVVEESGIITQGANQEEDFYSVGTVKMDGVYGACDSYSTREDITNKIMTLTLDATEVCYGNKLVIVADQDLRILSLLTEFNDPNFIKNVTDLRYTILERVGRSRYNGEITCGKGTFTTLVRDARSAFYHRKVLTKVNAIACQPISINFCGINQAGTLIQLQRYYTEKKLKKQLVIEFVVKLMKSKPNNIVSYTEIKKRIGLTQWMKGRVKNILKSHDMKSLAIKKLVPYRTIYPEAKREHWRQKHKEQERLVRIIQLRDPNVNVQNVLFKDEVANDNSSDEEDAHQGVVLNYSQANVAYKKIYDAGRQGLSLNDLIKTTGMDYYSTRGFMRSLVRRKFVQLIKSDVGSQRVHTFVAAHYADANFQGVVEEPLLQAEKCDDSTIDFIANVLNIDSAEKHHLTREIEIQDTSIDNPETTMGEYETIKLMRTINEISNEYKTIYENTHPFEKLTKSTSRDVMIPLDVPIITLEQNVRQLFGKINQSKSCENHYFNNDIIRNNKNNKKPLTTTSLNSHGRITSHSISFLEVRDISKLFPILKKQSLITKVPQHMLYKPLVNKASILLRNMLKIKDINNFTSTISEDEDDEEMDNSKDASLIVMMEDNTPFEEHKSADNLDIIRNIIIECFEYNEAILGNYLQDADKIGDESKASTKRPLDTNPYNTKRIKLQDNESDNNVLCQIKYENPAIDNYVKSVGSMPSQIHFGSNPVVLKKYVEDECEVEVVLSTELEKYADTDEVFVDKDLTHKVIERSHIIIDFIRINKIATDTVTLQHVHSIERMKGCATNIDKKTLCRNINRLISAGFVRAVKLYTTLEKFSRFRTMIFLPHFILFPYLNPIINATVFSLRTFVNRKCNVSKNDPTHLTNTAMPNKHYPANSNYKISRSVVYRYGFLRKFSRSRLLHQLMYYLIYNYTGDENSKSSKIAQYFNDDETLNSLPRLYKNEVTWTMFIPPLPKYKDHPDGWILVSDLFMRIPLSVFVKICSIVYIIPELPDFLNHPVKRHILIKDLPICIIDAMFCNRRYIHVIFPLFNYLCFMGLIQLGPQYARDKTEVYSFLNRRALLYDTSTSDPGYHEVTDKKYEEIAFYFDSEAEVVRFWNTVWFISARSKLGSRYSILGNIITLHNVNTKQDMIDAMMPIEPYVAPERDVGYIPGDRRGACGFDSALWIHIRRNWINPTMKDNDITLKKDDIINDSIFTDKIPTKPINLLSGLKGKTHKTLKTKSKILSSKQHVPEDGSTKNKIIRTVKPRNVVKVKKKYTEDDIDKELQRSLTGSRAKYTHTEHIALSICLSVLQYFKRNRSRVSFQVIRDFMHRVCKQPYKKTSSAYRRRIVYIEAMSRKDFTNREETYLINLQCEKFAQKYFKLFLKRVANCTVSDAELRVAFLYLSYVMFHKIKNMKHVEASFYDYLSDANVRNLNNIEEPCQGSYNGIYFTPIKQGDIKNDTMHSLIHSSLTCTINSESWHYLLMKTYRTYSEEIIRSRINHLRHLQLVSGSKGIRKCMVEGTILVTGMYYQLSFTYCFNQITNFPMCIYTNAAQTIASLVAEDTEGCTTKSAESFDAESMLALFEISCIGPIGYNIEQPIDILTMNPLISDHTMLVKELARRCGIIFKNIIIKSSASTDESDFSVQNIENIISRLINPEATDNVEGMELINTIIENSQFLDKDPEDVINEVDENVKSQVEFTPPVFEEINRDYRHKSLCSLKSLLTKGLFPELDDDEKLEDLENHFSPKYPNLWICNMERFAEFLKLNESSQSLSNIIDDMERDIIYNVDHILENLDMHFEGATLTIVEGLLEFVQSKKAFGATLLECYEFCTMTSTQLQQPFQNVIEKLVQLKYIMLHGIMDVTVIHVNFITDWTMLLDTVASGSKYVEKNSANEYRIKLMPWVKVDGTLYVDALRNWLCNVMSHCLSNPYLSVSSLITRFPFMKPLDIFVILKILVRIECISLHTYESTKVTTLFSENSFVELVPAPYHCDIAEVIVVVNSTAILKLGQILSDFKLFDCSDSVGSV